MERPKPSVRSTEQGTFTCTIIDETDPQNILSNPKRNLDLSNSLTSITPFSTEGFAENPERQAELARFLILKLGLAKRGALLDVGFGGNIYIANTFADLGISAFAIDEQQHDHSSSEPLWHAPRLVRQNEKGVLIYSGDIADLSAADSTLREDKFGTILFNGSWTAGGNNWTVAGEVMEFKYNHLHSQGKGASLSTKIEFMDQETNNILQECKNHLTETGVLGIVSARYAFHGAGYTFDQLPDEKLTFVEVYDRLKKLRARQICLIGISQMGFDHVLTRSQSEYPPQHKAFRLSPDNIFDTRQQLRRVADLPKEDLHVRYGDNPEFRKAQISRVIQENKDVPELNRLARIDAIFAGF